MILTGLCRLGRDAGLRYMHDGTPVLSLALAYNYGKKDAQGKRATQWVDASFFGDRAISLQPYLTKGQQINAYIDDISYRTIPTQGQHAWDIPARPHLQPGIHRQC
ncbi:single-stranded DNA-binding protein [Nitrosomonas sp.]|uniref:single-stranded DNA-binding protein n=1 Tax=Nitrosomonas sp. TaxID=42353 RepID=UPI0037CACE49